MPALSPLALALLFLLSLGLGGSYFLPEVRPFLLIAFFGLIGGITLELLLAPGKDFFKIVRKIAPKLSLGDANEVLLTVQNLSFKSARIQVTENAPKDFQLRHLTREFKLAPEEIGRIKYEITPVERGAYSFTHVSVRVFGKLFLTHQTYHIEVPDLVKVYPSYLQIKKYQLHTRRMNIELQGKKKQKRYGEGREFESLRKYTPDDEYRKINWKATARRGIPIVSQYQIERNQNVILLVDAGRMMRTLAGPMSKLDYAVNTALMMSFICIHKEDNVGLLIFNKGIQTYLPPRRGKAQLNAINEALYNLEIDFSEPNYQEAFNYIKRKVSRRSLIMLITDIIDERASSVLIREFTRLYPKHLPLAVTLKDNHLEAKALSVPQTNREMAELGVAQMLVEERTKALRTLQLNGVLTLDTKAEDLTVNAINRYLEIKAKSMI